MDLSNTDELFPVYLFIEDLQDFAMWKIKSLKASLLFLHIKQLWQTDTNETKTQ